MGTFAFSKKYRITRTYEYSRIYQTGRKVRSSNFLLFHLPSASGISRIGLSSSRKVGNAVVRNRVKRRMREVARQCRPFFKKDTDIVLVAHPRTAKLDYAEMEHEIRMLLKNADLL